MSRTSSPSHDPVSHRCLVIQHVEPEGPGVLATLLSAREVSCDHYPVFAGATLPKDLAGFDGMVVMGGPMSASSDTGFPTRGQELQLLEDAVRLGVPTLGVCLGAQLLALAGGGEVFTGTSGLEIGWGHVRLSPEAGDDPLFGGLPETLEVLHWHGDTFLPGPGSHLLASSGLYPAQAFRTGASAWGLQFHVEVDRTAARGMVSAFADEAALAEGGADAIVRGASPEGPAPGSPAATVLDRFAALVATGTQVARRRPSDVL